MATDHRKLPRRRGEALNTAIFQATLAELTEVGYTKLTMERVAERARASKASLYRRWSSRMELAMAAVYHLLPDPASSPDTGGLRGDLLALLRRHAELLGGPAGEAMRGLLSEALHDRSAAAQLRRTSQGVGRAATGEIARRAAERGEIDNAVITPARLEVGQAMLRQYFLFNGAPIPDHVVVEIVDEVLVPLFHAPVPAQAETAGRAAGQAVVAGSSAAAPAPPVGTGRRGSRTPVPPSAPGSDHRPE